MAREKKISLSTEERRLGAVLESVDSKLDLVVEGYKALDKKIDKTNKNLEEFKQDTDYRFKILTEMTARDSENIEIMKLTLNSSKALSRKKLTPRSLNA